MADGRMYQTASTFESEKDDEDVTVRNIQDPIDQG